MVLVDTSVWIDHLRTNDQQLAQLLTQTQVAMHPMVLGELACGNLKNRKQLIQYWQDLPTITRATDAEALYSLEHKNLMGKGIGYVDLHLLTSVLLSPGTKLWTRDIRLKKLAEALDCQWHGFN